MIYEHAWYLPEQVSESIDADLYIWLWINVKSLKQLQNNTELVIYLNIPAYQIVVFLVDETCLIS